MAVEKTSVEIAAIDNATRVFNQVSAAAKNLEKTYTSLEAAFASFVAGFALDKIVQETVEWERAANRLNATLKATGNAVGLTRRELDDMAVSLSGSTLFNERDIKNAEANLIKFGKIHGDVFSEALKLSADYAEFTHTDVATASQALGRAVADPVGGLRALNREFTNLTFTEKQYILGLEAQGKTHEAQIAILDLVRSRIGGTAEGANQGLTGFVSLLGKAWEHVAVSAGTAVSAMMKAARPEGELLDFGPVPGGAKKDVSDSEAAAQSQTRWKAALQELAAGADRVKEAHARAVPVLRSWQSQLSETSKEEMAMTLILEGEAKTWNKVDQAKLRAIARTLDMRRVNDLYVAGLKDYFTAQDKANEAQTSFNESTSQASQDLEFQISLIGKTTAEIEELTAVRNILLAGTKRQGEVNAELFPEQFRAIVKNTQDATNVVIEQLERRRKAERSWATGTKNSFNEYIDHATNAAEQASFLFTNAFHSMEDALVEFATTGKLNFKAFANSVIADIARILARQAIAAGAGAAGAAGFVGSLFGSSSSTIDPSAFAGHTGGVVGRDIFTRDVAMSPRMAASIPRYHSGLAPDERFGIFQTGETVLPRGARMGGVVQHFQIGGNVTRADLAAVAAAGRDSAIAFIAEARRRAPTGPFGG